MLVEDVLVDEDRPAKTRAAKPSQTKVANFSDRIPFGIDCKIFLTRTCVLSTIS
jgi:hypothetical protein